MVEHLVDVAVDLKADGVSDILCLGHQGKFFLSFRLYRGKSMRASVLDATDARERQPIRR